MVLPLVHTYCTTVTGTYMLHVSWNDHDLDQSPYTVIVLDPSNGSTSSISGICLSLFLLYCLSVLADSVFCCL